MPLGSVRKFLARRTLRNINIYRIDDFKLEPPEIVKNKTRVPTSHANLKIKAVAGKPFDLERKTECSAKRYKLFSEPVKSKNQKIKRYVKQDIKAHKIKIFERPKIYSPLKEIQGMPQERVNILKRQKKKIQVANNEMVIACYGPIVEGAVDRLILNKQQGTLLVWYSASSRQRKARNVYLIRRLGMNSKPEWRWQ